MRRYLALATLLLLAGLPGIALAQLQGGNIYGTAVDAQGGVLPGATVTLTGAQTAPRTVTAGAKGEFRFLGLAPGSYDVEVKMSGMADTKRSGVVVGVGQNVDLRIEMGVATAKTIEVTGQAPVLDTKKLGTSTNVSTAELQNIPSARDPWVVLQSVPGLLMDRINVGGSESGQQSVFVGKGDGGDNAMWNIDGVTITDMAAVGSSPTYYDFDSFDEVQISTGGNDIKLQTGGVGINLVTKRGGNDFHASGRVLYTNDDLQGSNVPDEIANLDCTQGDGSVIKCFPGNRIKKTQEYGAELGGPILKDKLWFWGSIAQNKVNQLALNDAKDNTTLTDSSVKINAQLGGSNQATGFWYRGNKTKQGRNASVTRPQETTWNQTGPTDVYKVEDFANFGSNFYLNGKFAYVGGGFSLTPQGGREAQTLRDEEGVFHGTFLHYETDRPQYQVALDGNYFAQTGSANHEFKFGMGWRKTPVTSLSSWPGDHVVADKFTGEDFGIAWLTRDALRESDQKSVSAYFGDTISINALTLNLGLRYDRQWGNNKPSSVQGSGLAPDVLPGLNFQGGEKEFTWNSLSPRIGLTYALGEDRKTLLRASYSLYGDQLQSGIVTWNNPSAGPGELDYFWFDTNGDDLVQRDEIDFATGVIGSYYLDPNNPGAATSPNKIDSDLSAPRTHEFIFGAEREVARNFSMGANFTYRRMNNYVWTPFIAADGGIITAADYFQSGVVTDGNITGNAGVWYDTVDGRSFSVPFYQLTDPDAVDSSHGQLLTNRDGYHQKFMGLEFTAMKRLSDRWMMRGSFAWNRWREYFDDPSVGMEDPTSTEGNPNVDGGAAYVISAGSGAKSDVFINAAWQFNVSGMYELPYGFNISADLNGRQGYLSPAIIRRGDPDGLSTAKLVLLREPDEDRLPNAYTMNLGLAKSFTFGGRYKLTLNADMFNVFNTNRRLQENRRTNTAVSGTDPNVGDQTGRAYLREREIIAPRLFRFGLRFGF